MHLKKIGDELLKNTFKLILKEIVRYTIGIIILVIASLIVGFLISKIFNKSLSTVYQIIGIVIMSIGILSVLGTKTVMVSHSYNLSRHVVDANFVTREDIKMLFQGQRFSVFMGLSGLVIVIIGWSV